MPCTTNQYNTLVYYTVNESSTASVLDYFIFDDMSEKYTLNVPLYTDYETEYVFIYSEVLDLNTSSSITFSTKITFDVNPTICTVDYCQT